MDLPTNLDVSSPGRPCTLTTQLMAQVGEKDRELWYRRVKIDQPTHELAIHRHWKFGKRNGQPISEQASLLDETIDVNLEATEAGLEAFLPSSKSEAKNKPKCQVLPPRLSCTNIYHEPDAKACTYGYALKRIGEDIDEKLDYTSGTFTVERYIRDKWACNQCEALMQTPVPSHVIDGDIPTAGLLAHVLMSKFGDHLPLYRRECVYTRAGLAIP